MHSTRRGAKTTTTGYTIATKWHEDGTRRNLMLRNPARTSHTKQRHQDRTRTKRSKCQTTSHERQSMVPEAGGNATTTSAQHTSNTRWTQGTTYRRTGQRRTCRIGTGTTQIQRSALEEKASWGHNRTGRGAKKHNPISRPCTARSGNCWMEGTDL